jgi:hypothetical protein
LFIRVVGEKNMIFILFLKRNMIKFVSSI